MNIVILIDYNEHRKNLWNGETIRTGGVGVSGTEQSFVLIGEEFAKFANVTIISSTCIPNTIYKGVSYNSIDFLKDNTNDIDILILQSDNRYFIQYSWLKLKKLIFWYHSQRVIPVEVLQLFSRSYPDCEIYCNTMTNYGESFMKYATPYLSVYLNNIFKVGNPLMIDMIHNNNNNNNNNNKEKHSFVFHAGFDRGGHITCEVFKRLNLDNKKLYVCGYDTLRNVAYNDNIEFLNSIDKSLLFNILSKTEYFIYPLVAPNNITNGNPPNLVHKDTFGCVIAEALAHNVIVLTYPVGAVKEIYGDHLIYLPFPSNANINSLNSFEMTFDETLNSEEAITTIIKMVEFLEARPELKEIVKKRGRELILSKYTPEYLANQWIPHLEY
jgi:glycosyltransferase involved in cell wall biosynthesis